MGAGPRKDTAHQLLPVLHNKKGPGWPDGSQGQQKKGQGLPISAFQ
jgi:hypothetical protein